MLSNFVSLFQSESSVNRDTGIHEFVGSSADFIDLFIHQGVERFPIGSVIRPFSPERVLQDSAEA